MKLFRHYIFFALWNVTYLKFTSLSIWPSLTKSRAVMTTQFFVQHSFQSTRYEIKHIIESDSRSMSVTHLYLSWAPQVFTRSSKLYLIHKTCEESVRLWFWASGCLILSPWESDQQTLNACDKLLCVTLCWLLICNILLFSVLSFLPLSNAMVNVVLKCHQTNNI